MDSQNVKYAKTILLIVWHILHMQIDMWTFHINFNKLNMPKDSQNICNELKSTVVCRVRANTEMSPETWVIWYMHVTDIILSVTFY